jgi:hypothetical protein
VLREQRARVERKKAKALQSLGVRATARRVNRSPSTVSRWFANIYTPDAESLAALRAAGIVLLTRGRRRVLVEQP